MLDLTKPLQTREGRKVRVVCTDAKKPDFPLLALVTYLDGREYIQYHKADGRVFNNGSESRNDLVNAPPSRHVHADLIIAWANGAKIEDQSPNRRCWHEATAPGWHPLYNYRIKPENT